jgi:hypothetical protein
MKMRHDRDPLPEMELEQRRYASLMQRLVLRNPAEDETVRLPLSMLAFWREPENELQTLQIRLNLPGDLDDDD